LFALAHPKPEGFSSRRVHLLMKSPLHLLRTLRRRVRMALGREPAVHPDAAVVSVELGESGASWRLSLEGLNAGSVVYSVGVGTDISFDRALIAATGASVQAFDPTPRSAGWIAKQSLPAGFHFHPVGLYDRDGELSFFAPANPEHVSFSIAGAGRETAAVTLKVQCLATLMRGLGHARVDLLKMDIEGSEYAVIDDIVKSGYPIRQLLVEFHHWMPGFSIRQTEDAVKALRGAGYRLFAISDAGHEFSFVHRGDGIAP
jgi:FkbM family methyltransferase